jgi:hypothetical protein
VFVINQQSATIEGDDGLGFGGGTLVNLGTIAGTAGYGAIFGSGSSVTNGTVVGGSSGTDTELFAGNVMNLEYYHIELEDHDVVLAEGSLAESCHDTGNRAFFHNAREGCAGGAAGPTCLDHDAPLIAEGDGHRAERGHTWTDGELSAPLFAPLKGAVTLLVHTRKQAMRYKLAEAGRLPPNCSMRDVVQQPLRRPGQSRRRWD